MTSFLLTEIALDLLGNKFYTIDGDHVRDLQSLYKLINDEPPTGEPTLASLLSIPETINVQFENNLDNNIIVLEDDDDEDNEQNISENIALSSSNENLSDDKSTLHDIIVEDDCLENNNAEILHSPSSTSGHHNKRMKTSKSGNNNQTKIDTLYKNGHDFTSDDIQERLSFIIQASGEEYARMRNNSNNQKNNFVDTNKTLINLKSIKEEDFLKRFYMQQKISLIEESNALMQFIKIVKNEDSHSQDVLIRVAGDILKAKDLIA